MLQSASRAFRAALFSKTTGMVLAGFSKTQMIDGIKAAVDKRELGAPATGSLIYMMSKEGYLTDQPPHNLNHLMYDLPRMDGAAWGANLPGVPIYFQQLNPAPITEFYVVMGNWSDGTPVNGAGNSASGSQALETGLAKQLQCSASHK